MDREVWRALWGHKESDKLKRLNNNRGAHHTPYHLLSGWFQILFSFPLGCRSEFQSLLPTSPSIPQTLVEYTLIYDFPHESHTSLPWPQPTALF